MVLTSVLMKVMLLRCGHRGSLLVCRHKPRRRHLLSSRVAALNVRGIVAIRMIYDLLLLILHCGRAY